MSTPSLDDPVESFTVKREELLARHVGPNLGMSFAQQYAKLVDETITALYFRALGTDGPENGMALVALGGYGRGRMAPCSDVDLLILIDSSANRKNVQAMTEAILYPLWDLKLTVGHAVRTPSQCIDLAKEDFATLTAQLDNRFWVGDTKLHSDYQTRIHRWLGSKSQKRRFFKELKQVVQARHHKYGASPYLLEPDLKEGQGGLRDIHAIGWAGRAVYKMNSMDELASLGFLTPILVDELRESRAFFMDVRLPLHQLAGNKTDILTFDLQEEIAARLKYMKDGHFSGVERFMKEFYTHLYKTKSTLDYFMSRVDDSLIPIKYWRFTEKPRLVEKGLTILRGRVELGTREEIRQRPSLLMRAFEVSSHSGLPISHRSLELIRTNLDLIDDDYRQDPQVAKYFFRGLTAIPPRFDKLSSRLDTGQVLDLLEAYIPELGDVRAQVQHDAYHVYTVDVHLVVALRELKNLAVKTDDGDEFDKMAFDSVSRKELLCLAVLLHDIGKGQGKSHAELGADMIPPITRRLGLTDADTETIQFLIREHLFLPEIATRRDLTEERLIVKCARRIGDVQRLTMLYLLTIADSRATGPGAINPWKITLLRDLYSKIYRVLTKSDLAGWEISQRTDNLLLEVERRLEDRLTSDQVDAHLENMSAHYLSSMTADDVVRHILLERDLESSQVIWEVVHKEEGFNEVTVLALDRPGLLSRLAGVFTLHNINILGAQVFTRANNIALDIFQVGNPPDMHYQEEKWKQLRRDAERVLTGHLAIDYRLAKKREPLSRKQVVAREPDKVVVDNDTSDFYTIVEIYTYDRLGVLYEITKVLFDLQFSISIAKISTKVDQVVDVFYVKDFFGQKITDPRHIQELEDALLFALNR